MGTSCPTSLTHQKVKFFTYGAILLKFESQNFDMFTNNNCDSNLDMRVP